MSVDTEPSSLLYLWTKTSNEKSMVVILCDFVKIISGLF